MTQISMAIMACRPREWMVDGLTTILDSPGSPVKVFYDPLPASSLPDQRWQNGRRAWLAADPNADWHVVLQDDALLSLDFRIGLEEALGHVPEGVAVTAYVGTIRPSPEAVMRRIIEADRRGESWIRLSFMYWGVAVALPTRCVRQMVAWGDRLKRANYDTRIGRWLTDEARWKTWGMHPSLVDHRPGKSLIGHDVPGRVAHHFHPGSALDVDWSKIPKTGVKLR